MMKKRMKALLAIGLSAIIMVCSAGCGNGKEHMKAETDPDIPVEDVSFPLKEKAELSFITSAPATSTQEPNEREHCPVETWHSGLQHLHRNLMKERFLKDWKSRPMSTLTGPVLYRISLMTKKIWRWHSSEIFRMDFLTQG